MIQAANLIRVVVVDDHAVTRAGIKFFVEQDSNIRVIGEAETGEAGIALCATLSPSVVLMDIGMPSINGIEATKAIVTNYPAVKVIVLTSSKAEKEILSALLAGASGYCLKNVDDQRLIAAIHSVSKGDLWIDSSIVGCLLPLLPLEEKLSLSTTKNSQIYDLSERETQVLSLIVEGKTNQAIALDLHLSVDTIKSHVKTIMDKLAVGDRTQAAVKAVRESLI